MRCRLFVLSLVIIVASGAPALGHEALTNDNADRLDSSGLVLLEVNWGRQWGCAGLENAQLQKISFKRLPDRASPGGDAAIELEAPSRLFVENRYKTYALISEPGVYALSGFDVKVAQSTSKIGHLTAGSADLFDGDTSIGGTFTVGIGEVVYIGHFSLDCSKEPVPWRYYIEGRDEFDRYVSKFKEAFPNVGDRPVQYRLFSTEMFGSEYSLENNVMSGAAGQVEEELRQ
jgi:hypothetical protein